MKPLLTSLLLLLLTSLASANGGGYQYGTKFTGSLAPFQPEGTENIQIIEEHLDITLGKKAAQVSVRYLMKNLTGEKSTARFGFPVEVLDSDLTESGEGGEQKLATAEETAKYCRDYFTSADGKPLPFAYQPEPFAEGKIEPFPGSDALAGIRGWMVSEVTFDQNQTREITVNYTSDYDLAEFSVSDDSHLLPATFRYRLSTGGVWGGPIKKGTVTVRAEGIPQQEVVIKSPADRFRTADNLWKWEFENLEPTLADDITIEAIPGLDEFRRPGKDDRWLGYVERLGVWSLRHQDFTAAASSSLNPHKDITYGPENIANSDWTPELENDAFRVWCEGTDGDGIGEFLEITPAEPAPLTGFTIRNGYSKSDELFAANNRVKTLTVSLNGEHSLDVELEDDDTFQAVFIGGYDKPVSKLRLTIKGVYPGSKFKDTCISNFELSTRLAKKPEVRGAR